MDWPWEYKDWRPSQSDQVSTWPTPTQEEVESLRDQLIGHTKFILDVPYNPNSWVLRSRVHINLGYPELAVADAYKAVLLVNAGLDQESELGIRVRVQCGMINWFAYLNHSVWTTETPVLQEDIGDCLKHVRLGAYYALLEGLQLIVNATDLLTISREALRLYPEDEHIKTHYLQGTDLFSHFVKELDASGLPVDHKRSALVYGSITPRAYPWISKENFQVRSDGVRDRANNDLRKCSDALVIRKSPIHGAGMFANRNIKAGETLFRSSTPFGVSYEQVDTDEQKATQCYNCFKKLKARTVVIFPCCPQLKFCSASCKKIANDNYHAAVCGRDVSYIYNHAQGTWGGKARKGQKTELGLAGGLDEVGGFDDRLPGKYPPPESCYIYPSSIPIILLRFLAACVQAGCHPLKHQVIEQLVPHHKDSGVQHIEEQAGLMGWSFYAHVSGPIKAMQTLGVDVFADPKYDTWVIMTMWHRIRNNGNGTDVPQPNSSVMPLYCWFNHSCAPSAYFEDCGGSSTMEVTASSDIEKGEELFMSYLGTSKMRLGWRERHKALAAWFSEPCECERCLTEEAKEAVAARRS